MEEKPNNPNSTSNEESAGSTSTDVATSNTASDTADQIDFMVKQFLKDIERLQDEIKEQRQMVKDATATDAAYKEIDDKIKELTKQRKTIQQDISQRPGIQEAKDQMGILKEDLKTAQKKLSDYLKQYVEEYNSKTFEDENGIVRDIVTTYKLVKRQS